MSAESRPISPTSFALAIKDLPLGSLFAKASELQNSLHHLRRSNEQLQPFADDGDGDCADAIRENREVLDRFDERVRLIKEEVEGRGSVWDHGGAPPATGGEGREQGLANGTTNGDAGSISREETGENGNAASLLPQSERQREQSGQQRSGRLSDAELQRLLQERMGDADDDDGGLHL